MAFLKPVKSEEEVKLMTPAKLRQAYNDLAVEYNKFYDRELHYCHGCDTYSAETKFYQDSRFASGYFYLCKTCVRAYVEQRKKKTDPPNETKESVQSMLQMMDLPYIDELYDRCVKGVADDVGERQKSSPFLVYLVQIKSLPQWRGKHWSDSEFGVESPTETYKINEKLVKDGRKRFGRGYSAEDYEFLEKEYEDWTARYACESKAQEKLFQRVCFKLLAIDKAQKANKSDKEISELDKSLQEIFGTLGIKPSQSNSNALTEAKTFGQLIEKWENEKPIPEPEGEFKDIDHIGKYVDVFFKGHLAKMMGLKNAFSRTYDNFMSRYTVKPPQYEEDDVDESLFNQIFGSEIGENESHEVSSDD